jgi:hypothetical protein
MRVLRTWPAHVVPIGGHRRIFFWAEEIIHAARIMFRIPEETYTDGCGGRIWCVIRGLAVAFRDPDYLLSTAGWLNARSLTATVLACHFLFYEEI